MCDTCSTHGPLSPQTLACRATPDQVMRLLWDILNSDQKPGGSTR